MVHLQNIEIVARFQCFAYESEGKLIRLQILALCICNGITKNNDPTLIYISSCRRYHARNHSE